MTYLNYLLNGVFDYLTLDDVCYSDTAYLLHLTPLDLF